MNSKISAYSTEDFFEKLENLLQSNLMLVVPFLKERHWRPLEIMHVFKITSSHCAMVMTIVTIATEE